MIRDFTVTTREAVSGTNGLVVRITATNYAGEAISFDVMTTDPVQVNVYDMISVTIEREGVI